MHAQHMRTQECWLCDKDLNPRFWLNCTFTLRHCNFFRIRKPSSSSTPTQMWHTCTCVCVCVCVCVHVYIHIKVYVYMHIHIQVYIYTFLYMCIYHIYKCIYTYHTKKNVHGSLAYTADFCLQNENCSRYIPPTVCHHVWMEPRRNRVTVRPVSDSFLRPFNMPTRRKVRGRLALHVNTNISKLVSHAATIPIPGKYIALRLALDLHIGTVQPRNKANIILFLLKKS